MIRFSLNWQDMNHTLEIQNFKRRMSSMWVNFCFYISYFCHINEPFKAIKIFMKFISLYRISFTPFVNSIIIVLRFIINNYLISRSIISIFLFLFIRIEINNNIILSHCIFGFNFDFHIFKYFLQTRKFIRQSWNR